MTARRDPDNPRGRCWFLIHRHRYPAIECGAPVGAHPFYCDPHLRVVSDRIEAKWKEAHDGDPVRR